MKNCLLTLAVVAALAVAGPAFSQHAYLDVNGDGLNYDKEVANGNMSAPPDNIGPGTTAIDVYFATNTNGDGSAATCDEDPSKNMTLGSYEAVLRYVGSGSVVFNGWSDNLGFPFGLITAGDGTFAAAGTDAWFARGGAPPGLPPGTHKVGTISVTVTGTPTVIFGIDSGISGNAQTAFGSSCDGARFDNTIRLGPVGHPDYDWSQSFGTTAPTPVVKSTWGKIKTLYH
jgi:hypothetical protein